MPHSMLLCHYCKERVSAPLLLFAREAACEVDLSLQVSTGLHLCWEGAGLFVVLGIEPPFETHHTPREENQLPLPRTCMRRSGPLCKFLTPTVQGSLQLVWSLSVPRHLGGDVASPAEPKKPLNVPERICGQHLTASANCSKNALSHNFDNYSIGHGSEQLS